LFYFEAVSEQPLSATAISLAFVLGQLAVSAIGVWRCYLANGGRAGRRFAERFIALGWVVAFRLFLVVAPPAIALFAAEVEIEAPWPEGAFLLVSVIYFWRLWSHILWVARHAENAA
jgi:hypothetical protein